MTANDDSASDVTLGVLAGGAGSRLGGRDKGLIEVGGRRLVEHVLARFDQRGATLISANRHHSDYQALGFPVHADEVGGEDWPGPVAAVITLLRHCQTTWLQLAPCDAPLLPGDLLARLRAVAGGPTAAVVPRAGGRHQWACSLLARSALPVLEDAFEGGTRRLGDALGALPWTVVDCEDQAAGFTNINTPEDLGALAAQFGDGEAGPEGGGVTTR